MCGRYSFVWLLNKLQDQFGPLKVKSDGFTKYNVAPGQKNPVILEDENKSQVIDFFHWGLIPHWAKEKPSFGFKTINARIETIEEKPLYKKPFLEKHCIVPATGFFEWKKSAAKKIPYYIHPIKQPYFGFAGIYESWETSEGTNFNSYSIITRNASKEMKSLHDRMPIILKKKHYKEWVSMEKKDTKKLFDLLEDIDTDLKFHVVSTNVNNPKNESPNLIKPLQQTLF